MVWLDENRVAGAELDLIPMLGVAEVCEAKRWNLPRRRRSREPVVIRSRLGRRVSPVVRERYRVFAEPYDLGAAIETLAVLERDAHALERDDDSGGAMGALDRLRTGVLTMAAIPAGSTADLTAKRGVVSRYGDLLGASWLWRPMLEAATTADRDCLGR